MIRYSYVIKFYDNHFKTDRTITTCSPMSYSEFLKDRTEAERRGKLLSCELKVLPTEAEKIARKCALMEEAVELINLMTLSEINRFIAYLTKRYTPTVNPNKDFSFYQIYLLIWNEHLDREELLSYARRVRRTCWN